MSMISWTATKEKQVKRVNLSGGGPGTGKLPVLIEKGEEDAVGTI